MASKPGPGRTGVVRTSRRSATVVVIGIVLFLVLDVVLVVWAMGVGKTDPGAQAGPIPAFTTPPRTSSAPSPTPTPTPVVAAAPRLLAPGSADVAWRAGQGACPAPSAAIEVSLDRGLTWAPVTVPGAHRVLGLAALDPTQVQVVSTSDDDCAVVFSESFTGGQFFERYPDRLSGAAYLDPVDPTVVRIDGSASTAPCAVLQVAVSDAGSGGVCAGELIGRLPGGTDWTRQTLPGLLSAASRDGGFTIARSGAEGCAGIAVESVAAPVGSAEPVRLGCVEDAAPSEVTLAARDGIVWLWSGSMTRTSADGGATWS